MLESMWKYQYDLLVFLVEKDKEDKEGREIGREKYDYWLWTKDSATVYKKSLLEDWVKLWFFESREQWLNIFYLLLFQKNIM